MAIDRTQYNLLQDDDGSNTVGTLWTKNIVKTVLLDPVDAAIATIPDGTAAAPSQRFVSEAMGWYRYSAGYMALGISALARVAFGTTEIIFGSAQSLKWRTAMGGADSLVLQRGGDNILEQVNGNADQLIRRYGANGGYWEGGSASELLVLSTGGATTDTTFNLLPATAIIEAVTARVTTTIVTATNWKLGDATIAGRFTAANATLTAGTTDVGTVQADQTGTSGPRQVAAAKVRVTTTGTPSAGAIRITVFYRRFVPSTS